MNEKFLEVGDVMQILGISRSAAYKLMRQINSELEKKGYIVIRGKVSRKYFEERIYGIRLAEAPSHGLPINLYDPKSTGAESYRLLAEEVMGREE